MATQYEYHNKQQTLPDSLNAVINPNSDGISPIKLLLWRPNQAAEWEKTFEYNENT
jgi:hypothetical protein